MNSSDPARPALRFTGPASDAYHLPTPFGPWGYGFRDTTAIMESQMAKKIEHKMETEIIEVSQN